MAMLYLKATLSIFDFVSNDHHNKQMEAAHQ